MSALRSFSQLRSRLQKSGRRVRLSVCRPADEHTLRAVIEAIRLGIVSAVIVGEYCEEIMDEVDTDTRREISFVKMANPEEAMQHAVRLVHDGEADILMKGLVNSDDLLHHILNKEYGLRTQGSVISHVAAFQLPQLSRLVLLTDVAVIPNPTLAQRAAQIRYASNLARHLGIDRPRVALLHCTEKVSAAFPVTTDYVELCQQASAGKFGRILVDGPLDLLCALSPEGLADKHLESALDGRADILIFPDIEAGNAVYKALGLLVPNAETAALLCGTTRPVVLTSRGDSISTKINSIALAALSVSEFYE